MDKGHTSWSGPTRISTESLPSKALSMTSGAVLTPVGDSETLDRSISQPNIAGGLKLPATVPPSPTVLASCSSTSSDLSRGGYASADSLGSMSSKDDMLSAPLMSDETQSLTTERSTRSASPCHENVPSLSITLEEQPERNTSLSASLEPTPDLVLNLPTAMAESTAVTHTLSQTLTSAAEMFASAEHGTIKKSGTPGRSSTSGEDGTSVDEVFPHTPVEITHALDGDSFSFDLLPSPPPALTDVPEVMKATDEECEFPPDNLPAFPSESMLHEGSSKVALPPHAVSFSGGSAEQPANVRESRSELTSMQIAESVADASEGSSVEAFASIKIDDRSSELKSSDLTVGHPAEPSISEISNVEITYKSADQESVDKLTLLLCEASGLSEDVRSESTDVAISAAELTSLSPVAEQAVNVHAALPSVPDHQEVVTSEQSSAAVLPIDATSCSSSALDAVSASETPDVVQFPTGTSSDTQSDLTVQSTTSVSPAELRPVPSTSPRTSSSPTCTVQYEVDESYRATAARRSSESAVLTSSNSSPASSHSAISHLVLATHKHASSIAVTSFSEPLPHRPPPSLAAHSAALELLSQRRESSSFTTAGAADPAEKPETSVKLEPSPGEKPKSKPPPVKKKPVGPLKEKFFAAASGDHQ